MVCRNGGYDIQKLLENALIFMNEIDIRDLLQNHLDGVSGRVLIRKWP
jgi:hypothetical protein